MPIVSPLAAKVLLLFIAVVGTAGVAPSAQAQSDTSTPTLDSFSRSGPSSYSQGSTVSFDYSSTDSSGVRGVTLYVDDPIGNQRSAYASGASGRIDLTLGATWATGNYRIYGLSLTDNASNTIFYYPSGGTLRSPSGASGPSSHSLDLVSGA